jgi:hypothetical protein
MCTEFEFLAHFRSHPVHFKNQVMMKFLFFFVFFFGAFFSLSSSFKNKNPSKILLYFLNFLFDLSFLPVRKCHAAFPPPPSPSLKIKSLTTRKKKITGRI